MELIPNSTGYIANFSYKKAALIIWTLSSNAPETFSVFNSLMVEIILVEIALWLFQPILNH